MLLALKLQPPKAKIHPRTKHLAIRLFHFRDPIEKGLISIEHVPSHNQLADIFTKPLLPRHQFHHLRDQIMGWDTDPITESTRECEDYEYSSAERFINLLPRFSLS